MLPGSPSPRHELPSTLILPRPRPAILRLVTDAVETPIRVSRVKNATGWGNTFEARWIRPGLVNYRDTGRGIGLVTKEAIDASMDTMIGRPLVIKHEPISNATGKPIEEVTPGNMGEVSCGTIARVWYNQDDGWYWCSGIVTDDEAKKLIRNGWSVSCCYHPLQEARGAALNGVPYNFEVKKFDGEHLALHPNPRYDGSRIRITNGKSSANTHPAMFKIFQKKTDDAVAKAAAAKATADAAAEVARIEAERIKNASTEATEISADTLIEIGDGQSAPLADVVASHIAYQEALKNGVDVGDDDEVEYDKGKKAKFGDLKASYKNAMDLEEANKRRIAEGTTTGTGGLANGALKNAAPATAPAKGARYFRLMNAATAVKDPALANVGKLPNDRLAMEERGRKRWGNPRNAAVAAGKN